MPSFDLALCMRMIWRSLNMFHFLRFEPFHQIGGYVARTIVAEQTRFVNDASLIAA